jgi:hypothetical protein
MKHIAPLFFLLLNLHNVFGQDFLQEYHEAYPVGNASNENNIRSITVDKSNTVYIANVMGAYKKIDGEASWSPLPFTEADKGPAYNVAVDSDNILWIGNWKGVFEFKDNLLQEVAGTVGPISVICISKEGVYALGPEGVWLSHGGAFTRINYAVARSVRGAVSDNNVGLWVASDVGLYHVSKKGIDHFYKPDLLLSAGLKGVAVADDGSLWAAGLGGISVIKNGIREKMITPAQGCPSVFVNCIKKANDGTMWVGTNVGVVRFYNDGSHSLRFSRRWLLDDQVNDVAFDQQGNTWIATRQGVSAIKRRRMSLADKQDYFYDVLMKRHIREPWIAGQCHLPVAGDTAHWQSEDDDNDGEYTGNYLAMESFRYAVTKSEDAREKAKKAFHFLKQLKDITGGDGYFARSIVPADWADRVHDNNRTYDGKEKAEELVNEPRFKPVEVRWHRSADGKWLWKGDASSDEWCGHMMGYFFYYQLAANEAEKEMVKQHVASLVDHLIAHHYSMVDADGTHARWSVWSPELLNHDPEWAPDKSQNSMELLTFLKLAYYLTNDEKYQRHYLRLINEEHYLENMGSIIDQNPAWFIYFDVTLQVYLFPILLHCEKDPKLLAFYQQYMDKWMQTRINDKSPLINFLYCYARNKRIGLSASLDFLVDTPLDLVDWDIDHTKREDVKLVHIPVLDELQVDEMPPASIRSTVRWDKNPWSAVGGAPNTEREPVFWLFPYWMGRYLKIISGPVVKTGSHQLITQYKGL